MQRYLFVGLIGLSLLAGCSADTAPSAGNQTSTGTPPTVPPAAPGVETAKVARTQDPVAKDETPTPATALDGSWTTQEAMALDGMRSVHQALQTPGTIYEFKRAVSRQHEGLHETLRTGGIESSDGYCYQAWTTTEQPGPFVLGSDPSTSTAELRICVYAWPADARSRRTFCASFEGVLMTQGQRYRGGNAPDGTAAFAAADPLPFASTHPRAGTGNDGQRWSEAPAQERMPTVQLRITNLKGKPISRLPVIVVPSAWQRRPDFDSMVSHILQIPGDLPIGQFQSDAKGVVTMKGIPTSDVIAITPTESKDVTVVEDQNGITLVMQNYSRLQEARASANESAAIATLKNLSSAQAQCQASGVIDTNNNGAGEYGFLAELAGAAEVRIDAYSNTDGSRISPPVLSGAFGEVKDSRITRSGYVFQVFLPNPHEQYVAEAPDGGSKGVLIHPALSEVLWCAYAWPAEHGVSGTRAFFVNQGGDILAADNEGGRYNGTQGPLPYAALKEGRSDAPPAANARGLDAQHWRVVN